MYGPKPVLTNAISNCDAALVNLVNYDDDFFLVIVLLYCVFVCVSYVKLV